jgi:hypothetical protein
MMLVEVMEVCSRDVLRRIQHLSELRSQLNKLCWKVDLFWEVV